MTAAAVTRCGVRLPRIQLPVDTEIGQATTGDLIAFSAIVTEAGGFDISLTKQADVSYTIEIDGAWTASLPGSLKQPRVTEARSGPSVAPLRRLMASQSISPAVNPTLPKVELELDGKTIHFSVSPLRPAGSGRGEAPRTRHPSQPFEELSSLEDMHAEQVCCRIVVRGAADGYQPDIDPAAVAKLVTFKGHSRHLHGPG